MALENAEINQDIAQTLKTVNEKVKQATSNVDIKELEKVVEEMGEQRDKQNEFNEEFNEVINQGKEDDLDLSDEIDKLEAEMNGMNGMNNYPKENNEPLVQDNKPTYKEPEGNLVFL